MEVSSKMFQFYTRSHFPIRVLNQQWKNRLKELSFILGQFSSEVVSASVLCLYGFSGELCVQSAIFNWKANPFFFFSKHKMVNSIHS